MGENSKIEWTHHTFNGWIGCEKVSAACRSCYAEEQTYSRVSKARGVPLWGPSSSRHVTSDANWRLPLRWNKDALAAGERRRVFAHSLSDVFEDRRDLDAPRARLFELIDATPGLDWLLLTKRPQNILGMVPEGWRAHLPQNVWTGCTVENNEEAGKRLPELLKVRATVRFASCEPLLEALDLRPWLGAGGLEWVIVGGESGRRPRPMASEWPRNLRDHAVRAGVPFLFKQWGEFNDGLVRLGKKKAGRLLDGREWNEFPESRAA